MDIYVTYHDPLLDELLFSTTKPLKYGYCIYARDAAFSNLIEFYRANKLPYLTGGSLGYYTPDLEYRTGFNYLVKPSNYSNWLKTQRKRYNQRQLLDML